VTSGDGHKNRFLDAEDVADVHLGFLVKAALSVVFENQTASELTQRKRDGSTVRPVKRENHTFVVDLAWFQPDLQATRIVPLRGMCLKGPRTYDAAVLSKEKAISLA